MDHKVPNDTLEKSSSLISNTHYILFLTVSCSVCFLRCVRNSLVRTNICSCNLVMECLQNYDLSNRRQSCKLEGCGCVKWALEGWKFTWIELEICFGFQWLLTSSGVRCKPIETGSPVSYTNQGRTCSPN